jgi:hypothetical protein
MSTRQLLTGTAAALLLASLTVVAPSAANAALPAECAVDETPTVTCTYRGQPGTAVDFVVPEGVTTVHTRVVGEPGEIATSQEGSTGWNGRPALVDADVSTVAGSTLRVEFRDNGGRGGPGAGNGGGSTAVVRADGALLVEAAGGGGAGVPGSESVCSGEGGPACVSSWGGDAGGGGGVGQSVGEEGHEAVRARGGASGNAGGSGGTGGIADVDTSAPVEFASGSAGGPSTGGAGAVGEFSGGGGGGGTIGGGGGGAGGTGTFTRSYGAGGGGGSSTVPSGGSVTLAWEQAVAQITYALDGRATFTPTSVDFGTVPVGSSATRTITVSNAGPGPTIVYGDRLSQDTTPYFTVADPRCDGGTVLFLGGSCKYTIRFRPTSAGVAIATFSFQDTSGAVHQVDVRGIGGSPILAAVPGQVDFGSVEVGTAPASRTVTFSNTGDADLLVGTVAIDGDSDFGLGPDDCSGATVPPGASCTVTVRFQPSAWSRRSGQLRLSSNALGGSNAVPLTGAGITESDIKTRGVGSLYVGRDHTVTRTVSAPGQEQSYPIVILNEDTVPHSFQVHIDASGFPASTVLRNGFTKAWLPSSGGTYTTPTVQPGHTLSYSLLVTPTGTGVGTSVVTAVLQTDFYAPIESVTTETNIAAPSHGTSSYELFAKQGSQPFIGGPTDGETTTGPALNVGGSTAYTVRLRNDGPAPAQIGLRLTDVDGCAGSFSTSAAVGTKAVTADVYAGSFRTRLLVPGAYQDVRVTIRRTATGCPSHLVRAESLHGDDVVRTSYLLANAAYNAAVD